MLPPAPPLSGADAAGWAHRPVLVAYGPWCLVALWGVCAALAVFLDDDPCTPTDPSVCGPDPTFAWAAVPLFATPVLLLWMPLAGCAAGIAFAGLDLLWDDVPEAKAAFAVHGLACAVLAWQLVRHARRQRGRAERLSRGALVEPGAVPFLREAGAPGPDLIRVGAAGLLLAAGVGLLLGYGYAVGVESEHVARARTVQAEVTAVDDDDLRISVRLDAAIGNELDVDVYEVDPYPVGSLTPVLVDPEDTTWVRLVAEPQDVTWLVSLGLGSFLLAAVLLVAEARDRTGVGRLLRGQHPALHVRVLVADEAVAVVGADTPSAVPAEGLVTHARIRHPMWFSREPHDSDGPDDGRFGEDQVVQDRFGEDQLEEWLGRDRPGGDRPGDRGPGEDVPWDELTDGWSDDEWNQAWLPARELETVDAVLVGDLRDRGWAILLTEDDVVPPVSRLRVGRRVLGRPSAGALVRARFPFPRRTDPRGALGADAGPRLLEASDLRRAVPLPHFAAQPRRMRLQGGLLIALAFCVVPVGFVWPADGWFQRGVVVMLGINLLGTGVSRARQGVWLRAEHLEIAGTFRSEVVPWDCVRSVYRDGDRLAVAWRPDAFCIVGPFARDGEPATGYVEQLGAQIMALHQQAAQSPTSATAGRARSRPGLVWPLMTGYAATVAVACWWVLTVA